MGRLFWRAVFCRATFFVPRVLILTVQIISILVWAIANTLCMEAKCIDFDEKLRKYIEVVAHALWLTPCLLHIQFIVRVKAHLSMLSIEAEPN